MLNKKYKLVKCFPGSPPIGTVATKTHLGYSTGGYGVLFIEDVENYSEFWELIKEPLFITEDGVHIFNEGDFFIVDTDYNQEGSCYFAWSIEKLFIKNKSYLPISSCVKIFSTEKAARDWIDLNKPMYSKKQIMDAALVKYVTGTILLHIKDIK